MQTTELTPAMGTIIHGGPDRLNEVDPVVVRHLLKTRGAVLLRGFEASKERFERFTERITNRFLVHHGISREPKNADATTQAVAPGTHPIAAHIERGYAAPIPGYVFFYCDRPAKAGGETTLFDGVSLYELLPSKTREFFESNKMRWVLRIRPQLWQRTFGTDSIDEALASCRQESDRLIRRDIGEYVQWDKDGDILLMDFVTPSTRPVERSRKPAFANSGVAYFSEGGNDSSIQLRVEDGSEFPSEMLEQAFAGSNKVETPIPWQAGDFVVIDNHSVMHGRLPFTDTGRSIYTRVGVTGIWRDDF